MSRVTFDPSIAAIVDIGGAYGIGYKEEVSVDFTATEEWPGNYEVTVYNSPQKTTSIPLPGAMVKDGVKLSFLIKPEVQALPQASESYYEVYNTISKRIEIKGNLLIAK